MVSGVPDQTAPLVPVAAYPRRALEQYLADAQAAEHDLRTRLDVERRRLEQAQRAIDACGEGHRLLGAMMVTAQQDLAARRRHASDAADAMVRDAEAEAQRIVAEARAEATAILAGLPAPAKRDDRGSAGPSTPDHPEPLPAPDPPPAADAGAPSPALGAASVAALAAAIPALALGRRTGRGGSHGRRWRSLRRHDDPFEWPYNAALRDEAYFSRLRDEMRAEGALGIWFETA